MNSSKGDSPEGDAGKFERCAGSCSFPGGKVSPTFEKGRCNSG